MARYFADHAYAGTCEAQASPVAITLVSAPSGQKDFAVRPRHWLVYDRFIRWNPIGVFSRIFAGMTGRKGRPDRLMIGAAHLKAHGTTASPLKKGLFPDVSTATASGKP